MRDRMTLLVLVAVLAAPVTAAEPVIITPLLHASVQLEGDGKVVQIDP